MSDVIQKPGLYKQQNGKPAEVKWVGEGKALGFDFSGEPTMWDAATGRWALALQDDEFCCHIAGPWIPEPPEPPEPPEGFRVMPNEYVAKEGDQYCCTAITWGAVRDFAGKTAAELDKDYAPIAPYYIASPIPKPEPKFKCGDRVRVKNDSNEHPHARGKVGVVVPHWNHENGWVAVKCEGISIELGFLLACGNLEAADPPNPAVDPGEGWRLLGDEETIEQTDEVWSVGQNNVRWSTIHTGCELCGMTVAEGVDWWVRDSLPVFYRRRVVPQPEWTPTNELRLAKTVFDDPLGTWYGKGVESLWLRIEQRWTNGTDSEWRPVTVEGA